jgi:phosphate/sulfate permease
MIAAMSLRLLYLIFLQVLGLVVLMGRATPAPAFSHGADDAQKSIGVIAALLLAAGRIDTLSTPLSWPRAGGAPCALHAGFLAEADPG